MMKYILIPTLLFFLGCSHSISRIGYVPNTVSNPCAPIFKYAANLGQTPVTKIGAIKLGDTGFSVNCNKTDAMAILLRESCSIGADMIIIVEEKEPGLISTCYRVEADFVRLNDPKMKATLQSDDLQ